MTEQEIREALETITGYGEPIENTCLDAGQAVNTAIGEIT